MCINMLVAGPNLKEKTNQHRRMANSSSAKDGDSVIESRVER